MSENHLRLRHISNYTTSENRQTNTQKMSSDQRLSSDPNHSKTDQQIYEEIDDKVCDNESENLIKKFSKNEKQELIELLYSEDVIKFNKNHIINEESNESDADNEEVMTSFINDRKPLLQKTKRKSVGKPFKTSEVLFTGFDDDFEDHIIYDESLLSLFFQVFVPFLIAGFGTVGAGLVLDYVQVLYFKFLFPFCNRI